VVVVAAAVVVVAAAVVVVAAAVVVVAAAVVVVAAAVVVVAAAVVVVAAAVVVVVVPVPPVTMTMHPLEVAEIGLEFVSKRDCTVSPMVAVVLTVATTLNVILATLTTPVGPVRLLVWKAAMFVVPVVNEAGFVVGEPANSAVVPPATDAIVTTAGLYVTVIEYAPSGTVPTSIVTSVMNGGCPTWTVPGQPRVACAA